MHSCKPTQQPSSWRSVSGQEITSEEETMNVSDMCRMLKAVTEWSWDYVYIYTYTCVYVYYWKKNGRRKMVCIHLVPRKCFESLDFGVQLHNQLSTFVVSCTMKFQRQFQYISTPITIQSPNRNPMPSSISSHSDSFLIPIRSLAPFSFPLATAITAMMVPGLVKFSSVTCGGAEQTAMIVAGATLWIVWAVNVTSGLQWPSSRLAPNSDALNLTSLAAQRLSWRIIDPTPTQQNLGIADSNLVQISVAYSYAVF